ncbi:MAG: DUF1326 domain-containing protein [Actinomycetota bacterium]
MAYRIAGTYVLNCSCNLICPCGVDGPPTSKDGKCHGAQVMHIADGNKDDVDLSNVTFGWVYELPGKVTEGNWTSALIIDPSASEEQAQALEDIMMGRDGGPFAEFAPLISTWKPTERAPVTFTPGDEPKGAIGKTSFTFHPLKGADGNPTTVKNAMLGFAPEYEVGTGSGTIDTAGISFEPIYGEHAEYEFAS